MNIFEEYKNKILEIIKNAEKDKLLTLPENLNGINVDSTPPKIEALSPEKNLLRFIFPP